MSSCARSFIGFEGKIDSPHRLLEANVDDGELARFNMLSEWLVQFCSVGILSKSFWVSVLA